MIYISAAKKSEQFFYGVPTRELFGVFLNRERANPNCSIKEAVLVLNELLKDCRGLDGHALEWVAPSVGMVGIKSTLKVSVTRKQSISSPAKRAASGKSNLPQTRTTPDTLIIYQK
jgi:hypothetical protein